MKNLPKILIIDDDADLRTMLQKALEEAGSEVLTVADGVSGLKLLEDQAQRIGVILTDIVMPGMDGMEVLRRARALDPDAEVIVLTGHGSIDTAMQAIREGAHDYLRKPIGIDDLIITVKRAVNHRNLRLENRRHREDLERLVAELKEKNSRLAQTLNDLHETQLQLIQAEKLASVGQLAAGLAHEINNPVGYVYSNLQTLSKYLPRIHRVLELVRDSLDNGSGESQQQLQLAWEDEKLEHILNDFAGALDESINGTERVKDIVEGLGQFSRMAPREMQESDIVRGLESTFRIVEGIVRKNAEVMLDLQDLPPVRCNPFQVNQVFMNLLINASQAIAAPPGEIRLRAYHPDVNHVIIEVWDNGKGITQEDLPKIFDPFFTTREESLGIGLGLSVSRKIVAEHGGDIRVESEPGKGTVFRVILPVNGPVQEAG